MSLQELFRKNVSKYGRKNESEGAVMETLQNNVLKDGFQKLSDLVTEKWREIMKENIDAEVMLSAVKSECIGE